jgi:hypothetical protein
MAHAHAAEAESRNLKIAFSEFALLHCFPCPRQLEGYGTTPVSRPLLNLLSNSVDEWSGQYLQPAGGFCQEFSEPRETGGWGSGGGPKSAFDGDDGGGGFGGAGGERGEELRDGFTGAGIAEAGRDFVQRDEDEGALG